MTTSLCAKTTPQMTAQFVCIFMGVFFRLLVNKEPLKWAWFDSRQVYSKCYYFTYNCVCKISHIL